MLAQDQNELLTRVGPKTPMGEMMRRYWHPIATSSQLPNPDCPPFRGRLLGENFVVFRDTEGKVGVLDEQCMHRGVSLAIGRVEEGGIRCLYHGWKYSVDGTILETPNHADCRLRERLKAKAYPVVEKSGLIWTYIGPAALQPPFREFATDDLEDENLLICRIDVKANYLQLWEGGLDSSHVSVLHTNQTRPSWAVQRGAEVGVGQFTAMEDMAPKLEIEDTAFGYHYAAIRRANAALGEGMNNIRIVPAIMPTGRIIPGPKISYLIWETPTDDYNTSTYVTTYSQEKLDKDWAYNLIGLDNPAIWTPENPEFKPSWENGFMQDREGMTQNWTGLRGIEFEDAVMGLASGTLYDRANEHLVSADAAVVRIRRRLLENIRLAQAGEPVMGANIADMRTVAAPDVNVPISTDWRDLAPLHRVLEAAE